MRVNKMCQTYDLFVASIIVVEEPLQLTPSRKWCWVAALNGAVVCNQATLAEDTTSPRCVLEFQKSKAKTWKNYMNEKFVDEASNMVSTIRRCCSAGGHLEFVTWAQYLALKKGTTRMAIRLPSEIAKDPLKSDKFACTPEAALKKLTKWNHARSYISDSGGEM